MSNRASDERLTSLPSINGSIIGTRQKKRNDDNIQGFDQQTSTVSSNLADESKRIGSTCLISTDSETQTHRSSGLRNNPLSGITFPRYLRLLFTKRHSIDWWRYKYRLFCLFLMSLFNSILELIESIYIFYLLWQRNHDDVVVEPKYLFILGHPRTGTTLLHTLLALNHHTPNTFMVGFPHAFLCFEKWGKVLLQSILDPTRPMDDISLHFDLPQEDELATVLLTGGQYSPYMSIYFPRDEAEYHPYMTMKYNNDNNNNDDDEKIVIQHGIQQHKRAFLYFLQKCRLRNPRARRWVLKSPVHTGRVQYLIDALAPQQVQFVFIHRHPEDVFWSAIHMANTTYGYAYLQQPTPKSCKLEFILSQGELLLRDYIANVENKTLYNNNNDEKKANWSEVSFDELALHPVETVQGIYKDLGIEQTPQQVKQLEEYCKCLRGYRPNSLGTTAIANILSSSCDDSKREVEELLCQVRTRWKFWYDYWGYKPRDYVTTASTSTDITKSRGAIADRKEDDGKKQEQQNKKNV